MTLDEFREKARERYGIPKGLWESIRGQESGGDTGAVSPTGVRGEFQVTKKTAGAYGLDRDDPFHQAAAAAKNLREGYDRHANLKDDNERWLAASAYYYGGPDAVKPDGTLSTGSKDQLSNPSEYVTGIARRWKQFNDSQATAPLAAKPVRPQTARQAKPVAKRPPKSMAETFAALGTPEDPAGYDIQGRPLTPQRERFAQKPWLERTTERTLDALARGGGNISKMARQTAGAAVGASEFLAGKPFQAADFPAWRRAEEERAAILEERRLARPSSFATEVGEGIVEALPTAAAAIGGTVLTGGGLPAMMGIGGGMAAAGADWRDPKRAATQTALGAVAPVVGGRIGQKVGGAVASRLARPAAQTAARVGGELAGGGAGNILATGGEQLAFEGELNPRELAKSGIVGAALNVPGAIGAARRPMPVRPSIPVETRPATPRPLSADENIRAAIDRYTRQVDAINRSQMPPDQKAAQLEQVRADYLLERSQAAQPRSMTEPGAVAAPPRVQFYPSQRTPGGAIYAQPSSLPSRRLLPPASTQPLQPQVYPDAQTTQRTRVITPEMIAAENAPTTEQPILPQRVGAEPVRQTAEMARPTGAPIQRPRTERLPVPKATDENIGQLRARQEALGRFAYDRRGDFTGDLRDEYNQITAHIRDYENARAPREVGPPPEMRPERFAPPLEEREARRAALQPKTGPMPETLTPGRKVTRETQLPPGLKPTEAFTSREDARQGHFERFSDEELVGEIRRLEDVRNQGLRGKSTLSRAELEANNFDLRVAVEMQKERGRLQRQMGREPGEMIAPRTPARPAGRKIQHTTFGEVTEAPNQKGVPTGKLRVMDADGGQHLIQNPRTRGNREAAFAKSIGPVVEPSLPMEQRGQPDILRGMKKLARTPSSPVEVAKLREQFPGMNKADFDAAMTKLNEEGRIALHRHDHPASLSEAQRNSMVKIGNDYFTAATIRERPGQVMGMGLGGLQGMFGRKAPKANPTPADIEGASIGRAIGGVFRTGSQAIRTVKTSFDLSAPFGQAAFLTIPHPLKSVPAFGRMLRAGVSKKQSAAIDQEILNHPLKALGDKFELHIATGGPPEEAFMLKALNKVWGIGFSERTYRTYLDTLRLSVWEGYVKSLQNRGFTPDANPKAYRDAAAAINIASGRGSLKPGGKMESAMALGGDILFAPRNLVAKFQMLDPVRYMSLAPGARKLVWRDAAINLSVILGTAALLRANGHRVGLNPEEDDFLTLRLGNTRYDLTAGAKQQVQFLARMAMGAYRQSTGEGNLPGKDPLSVAKRYARGKLAPGPGLAIDAFKGEDFKGEKFADKSKTQIAAEFGPMIVEGFYEGYKDEGMRGGAKNAGPAFLGARVATYPDRAKAAFIETPAELRAEQKQFSKTRSFLTPRRAEKPGEVDETPAQFAARKTLADQWTTEYGRQLAEFPRYKAAEPAIREAALDYLKKTIADQSNEKRPSLYLLRPSHVLQTVQGSERKKRREAARQ